MPAAHQQQKQSSVTAAAPVTFGSLGELHQQQFGSMGTVDSGDSRVFATPTKARELPVEMQKIKKVEQIKQYFESNRLPVKIEQCLNRVVTSDQMPDDCVGSFVNHISAYLPTPIIRTVEVLEGIDSRGQSTFIISIDCLYRLRNHVGLSNYLPH